MPALGQLRSGEWLTSAHARVYSPILLVIVAATAVAERCRIRTQGRGAGDR
jgi:hypothetical protein